MKNILILCHQRAKVVRLLENDFTKVGSRVRAPFFARIDNDGYL